MKKKEKNNGINIKMLAVFFVMAIILSAALTVFVYNVSIRYAKENGEPLTAEDTSEEPEETERIFAEDSFYQKIHDGKDVNILIIGDSIGAGSGASELELSWANLVATHVQVNYGINVNLTNISMSGNTSYAGYVRTMALSDDVEYDLAIICYGENDSPEHFSTSYESIIRAVRNKYKQCSIISVLESSQRAYTDKIFLIQVLDAYYYIPAADTIEPFTSGEYGAYEDLTVDGTHPNDAGHQIYANVINGIIDEQAAEYAACDITDYQPLSEEVTNFDHFLWLDVTQFVRDGNTFSYSADQQINGIAGIDYTYVSGANNCTIYADGNVFSTLSVQFDYDFTQRHIVEANGLNTFSGNTITVSFETEAQADGFNGLCFSWGE